MQIVYEITLEAAPELLRGVEDYMMTRHIPEVLSAGGFIRASFESSLPGRYRVRYLAADRETLDRYLKEHAPRLRSDVAENFPAGLEIVREEWNVLATFPTEAGEGVA